MSSYVHTFPCVRGMQAGRPCYIAMCPMRLVPRIFVFNEENVPADLRAQRKLNLARVPEIASYLVENKADYTLSAITASVNASVQFDPFSDTGSGQNIGTLSIPMDAQILINDGQHRRAAIEQAIQDNPELGYDNIPVLFFIDEGLQRSQQMFADLNKHAVRPSDSISTLYDHRDHISDLARYLVKSVDVFSRMTELEKSSLSHRSSKLFTLSAIKNASKTLLKKGKHDHVALNEKELSAAYWSAIASHMPDWLRAKNKDLSTADLRDNYIHAHGVMLQAMGIVGADLIIRQESEWTQILKNIRNIDWSRSNSEWEGRAMVHGRISKATTNVALTANLIKQKLGIPLSTSEQEIERKLKRYE
ncbi:DNA sulfur modification protein DndB [Pseudomonas sp. Gutcm_11s]|uniref:DNA sulfur modification protein DndB n=1 Tax=Pseudomonas sp. Gutcm_11s TaxID=3026088 RepID=UPI00236259C4|nr:DNA sulfur modification protein DndB [Pseudomonas sp. Gutcm_11s]MDD0841179.1 DNA sulfur modification protein DndB [Pseudomonas sp. Gutcm_11s]